MTSTSQAPESVAQPAQTAALAPIRRGPGYWLASYLLMMRWELLSLRLMAPIMVAVQLLIGAGMVVGFGFLFDEVPAEQALFLATGAAVIPLLTLGLVMVPQTVATHKLEGTYDFILSLPVPRLSMFAAALTVMVFVGLPGGIAALIIGTLRYDLAVSVSPLALPAGVLVTLMAAAVGYAFAYALPNPRVTNFITQLMIFVVVMFSPVNFPAERLPGWLQALHGVLPIEHSAVVMRGTLTDGLIDQPLAPSFAIVAVWTAASIAVTAWVLGRRP